MEKLYLLLIVICLLVGCDENRVVSFAVVTNVEKIETEISQMSLPLDSTTSQFNYLNQAIELNGYSKYLIFNGLTSELLQYDIEREILEKSVKFETQGPYSLQGLDHGSGMHYVNRDTIFFFSSSLQTLFVADLKGHVYSEFSLINDSIAFGSFESRSIMDYKDGSLYLQSFRMNLGRDEAELSKRKLTISEYVLNSQKLIQHPLPFADFYSRNNFSQRLEVIDFIYAPKIDRFIVSLPLDQALYFTDLYNDVESVITPSNLVKSASQINLNNNEIPLNSFVSYYYWTSDSFGRLFYDRNKNYIYRIAKSKITHDQFLSKDFYAKQEVLVLNDKRELLGSIPHSGASFIYHFFNERGVAWNSSFKEFNGTKTSEDRLHFEHYEIYK